MYSGKESFYSKLSDYYKTTPGKKPYTKQQQKDVIKEIETAKRVQILVLIITAGCQRHDVCDNYWSYAVRDFTKHCRYSPDIFNTVCEIVERHVGKCETHHVTTEDGYILPMFRIPLENPKGVVLLQHPVLSDANIWTVQEDEATAFLFWRNGYDVWMGNNRGNYYTKRHVNLTRSDAKFWDFSFHEIGLYDYKAMIEYIRNETHGQKVIFVGHSMSSTSIMIYASHMPKLAQESMEVVVHIAPVVDLVYTKTKAKYLAPLWKIIQIFNIIRNAHSIGAYDSSLMKIVRPMAINTPFQIVFPILISFFSGGTPREIDPELINLIFSEWPSESAWKVAYHYAQVVQAKRFQMYDYSVEENLKRYGRENPPLYALKNITTPNFVIHSMDDHISVPEDVDIFYNQLQPDVRAGKVQISGMSHVDCHFGKNRIAKFYVPIFKFLDDFQKNSGLIDPS